MNHVHYSSESGEWLTPQVIIDKVLEVFSAEIDLDPAAEDITHARDLFFNVPAIEHYSKELNGLAQPWNGRVYLNPPYGKVIIVWVEKMIAEYENGNMTEGIALLPARTDTKWFHLLNRFPRCFIRGRLRFSGHENGAPFPSMVVYFGEDQERFAEAFEEIGAIFVHDTSKVCLDPMFVIV